MKIYEMYSWKMKILCANLMIWNGEISRKAPMFFEQVVIFSPGIDNLELVYRNKVHAHTSYNKYDYTNYQLEMKYVIDLEYSNVGTKS